LGKGEGTRKNPSWWTLQKLVVNIYEITAYVRSQQSSWKFGITECIFMMEAVTQGSALTKLEK